MRVIERSIQEDTQAGGDAPAARFTLDVEELQDYPTDALPGFTDRLLATLPGLEEHEYLPGEPGSLGPILREGMCIGHLVEHVVLELLALAGLRAGPGGTRAVEDHPGLYTVTLACRNEALALTASRMALELVASLLPPDHRPVLGLGLLAAPIETSDADGPVPGLASLTMMAAAGHEHENARAYAREHTLAGGRSGVAIDVATLDLLAPVDLLAPIAPVA